MSSQSNTDALVEMILRLQQFNPLCTNLTDEQFVYVLTKAIKRLT